MQLLIISRTEELAQTCEDWIGAPVKSSAQWVRTFDYYRREEQCLGSSAELRATELREAHRERVARNEVRVSPLWSQPCRAYNLHIELDARTKSSLGKTQQALERVEPSLLTCPREALHVSIAWLLAVHVSYPVSKDLLCERQGEEWMTELNRIAAEIPAFRITYGHVVATDSAVITLAEPSEPVNRIREMIHERLTLPSETRNEAELVHTTLFRYRGPLFDAETFLTVLEDTRVGATAEVDELVVSRELVYPSLETEVLVRLPLASG
jgi:hypothetical protein